MKYRYFMISIFLLLFLNFTYGDIWTSGYGSEKFNSAILNNVKLIRDTDGSIAVRLADNQYKNDNSTDLLLHFNYLKNNTFPFFSKNYSLGKQYVFLDRLNPLMGSGCLKFLKPKHYVSFIPGKDALLSENTDIGSFTFEFWLYPYSNYDNEEIFSKYGPFTTDKGETFFGGIKSYFKNSKVAWQFKNFFRDNKGKFYNFTLTGNKLTILKKWQHIAVTYDHFTGKLTKYINGLEDEVIWVTDTGKYGGSPLIAAFHKNLFIYPKIGANYLGKIDVFRISRVARQKFNCNKYVNKLGKVVSRVFDMGTTHSKLNSINWKYKGSAGSTVLLEYRVSNRIFTQNDPTLNWIKVKNGQTYFYGNQYGRYVQWRATLHGVINGKYSPVLSEVNINYKKPQKLLKPVGIIARPGDKRIYLKWTPNTEYVEGYKIFIGTEKGEYLHPISPINVSLDKLDKKNPEYVIYGLENDRLYYIVIAAYDNKGFGHQSEFSKEVYARPSVLLSN